MFDSKKLVKVVSVAVASMSLLGVSTSVSEAATFTAPKLGVSEVAPTNPSIKKGTRSSLLLRTLRTKRLTF